MLPPFFHYMVLTNHKDEAHVMIIFGIREKKHTCEAVINVVCKNCGHTQHVSFGISRYFHMFWVPLMVTSRQVGLRCSNCSKVSVNDDIPLEEQQRIRKNIFTPLRTLPLYFGSFLLIAILSLLYFAHLDNEKEELARIQSPRVHDVYSTDLSAMFPDQEFGEYRLGAMRILSVTDEGVLLVISKESFIDILKLSKNITRNGGSEEFYGDKTLFLSNEDVINLYNAETIRSITRVFKPINNSKPIEW